MHLCDECIKSNHGDCWAFSDSPFLTQRQRWCECWLEIENPVIAYYVGVPVTELTRPSQIAPHRDAQDSMGRNEAAWRHLAKECGGFLSVVIVNEVKRRHGVMSQQAFVQSRELPEVKDAIASVLHDVHKGLL
jgi:hypothetical protein